VADILYCIVYPPTRWMLELHVKLARLHERTRDPFTWAMLRKIGAAGIRICEWCVYGE
jgi:hypothetical protein